jgi:hypothetical protein
MGPALAGGDMPIIARTDLLKIGTPSRPEKVRANLWEQVRKLQGGGTTIFPTLVLMDQVRNPNCPQYEKHPYFEKGGKSDRQPSLLQNML